MIRYNYGDGPCFFTDASQNGYGCFLESDWHAGYFNVAGHPDGVELLCSEHGHWKNIKVDGKPNINLLELVPVWLSLLRWIGKWEGLHVVCYTDNMQVRSMLNKGVSSNSVCMDLLRSIFWLCAIFNVHLTARHLFSEENRCADFLSRLSYSNDLCKLSMFSLCCRQKLTPGCVRSGIG